MINCQENVSQIFSCNFLLLFLHLGLTSQEADSPEAGVQRGLDVSALVQGHNHALLQVQPVVCADCHSQQPQATDCKHATQQCQGFPAAHTHGDGRDLPVVTWLKLRKVPGAI